MPYISIIMPVYNVEKYVKRCLDSVLAQTFADFEVIIVDDGSIDSSGLICDSYSKLDSRIKVFHVKNGGVSAARNHGLQHATGEYLAFCDSDDFVHHTWLQTMIENAKLHESDYVISAYDDVDEAGKVLCTRKRFPGAWDISKKESKIDYIINHLLTKTKEWNGWELWTSLFCNRIVKENRISFCTSCHNFAEDLGFILEFLLYANKVSCTAAANYCYVHHDGSMMARTQKVVMLDSLNEVSRKFGVVYRQAFPERKFRKLLPVLHLLIIHDQYDKIKYGEDAKRLRAETKKIRHLGWFNYQSFLLLFRKRLIVKLFPQETVCDVLLWSHYSLHKCWRLFAIESAIRYRAVRRRTEDRKS